MPKNQSTCSPLPEQQNFNVAMSIPQIQHSSATFSSTAHPYLAGRLFTYTAHTTESDRTRTWAAKGDDWQWPGFHIFGIRLGAEMVYYALAKHNGLPMPESRILSIDGVPYWGTEIIEGRVALGKADKLYPNLEAPIRDALKTDGKQVEACIRAAFLDIMLLNSDRTVSNVLRSSSGELFFFDHEQCVGWHANIEVFGQNRILTPTEEYFKLVGHPTPVQKYGWGRAHSELADRKRIFESLKLDPSLLDELRPQIPEHWISKWQFPETKAGLTAWWQFVRSQPYEQIDAKIF